MTNVDPLPRLVEHREPAMWPVTLLYILVTIASVVGAFLPLFFGGTVGWAVVLLLAQLAFLAPLLRRRLDVRAVWTMVVLPVIGSGLGLAYMGSYFLASLFGPEPITPLLLLWMAAALVAATAAGLAVVTGSVVVALAVTSPPRWRTACVIGLAMLVIVMFSTLLAWSIAPF